MEHELDAMKNDPQGEFQVTGLRSAMAAYAGQVKAARTFGQKQREAAERLGFKEAVANEYSQEAFTEATFLNKARALEDVTEALKLSQSPKVVLNCAVALAMVGENARAAKLADDVAQKRPYDTLVQFVEVPLVKAQIELNQGGSAKAIDLLDSALVYARANPVCCIYAEMLISRPGRGSDAVQAFQRLLDLKNMIIIDPVMPLGKVGLARAYVMAGDKARARLAYQDFLAGWKRCGSGCPDPASGQGRVREIAVGMVVAPKRVSDLRKPQIKCVNFLGTDVAQHQRRVIVGQAAPDPAVVDGQTHALQIDNLLPFAIAYPDPKKWKDRSRKSGINVPSHHAPVRERGECRQFRPFPGFENRKQYARVGATARRGPADQCGEKSLDFGLVMLIPGGTGAGTAGLMSAVPRAMRILACPRWVTKMFPGFMSRWTIPLAWAASSASAMSMPSDKKVSVSSGLPAMR